MEGGLKNQQAGATDWMPFISLNQCQSVVKEKAAKLFSPEDNGHNNKRFTRLTSGVYCCYADLSV